MSDFISMETSQNSRDDESRNRENNAILKLWEQVASTKKRKPAIFAPDGTVWRTFSSIEEEAMRWADRLARQPLNGAVCLQIGNRVEWPAILLATWRSGRTLLPMEREI